MNQKEITNNSLYDFLCGYTRNNHKGAKHLLTLDDWKTKAEQELRKRQYALIEALDNDTLHAIANGEINVNATLQAALDNQST